MSYLRPHLIGPGHLNPSPWANLQTKVGFKAGDVTIYDWVMHPSCNLGFQAMQRARFVDEVSLECNDLHHPTTL